MFTLKNKHDWDRLFDRGFPMLGNFPRLTPTTVDIRREYHHLPASFFERRLPTTEHLGIISQGTETIIYYLWIATSARGERFYNATDNPDAGLAIAIDRETTIEDLIDSYFTRDEEDDSITDTGPLAIMLQRYRVTNEWAENSGELTIIKNFNFEEFKKARDDRFTDILQAEEAKTNITPEEGIEQVTEDETEVMKALHEKYPELAGWILETLGNQPTDIHYDPDSHGTWARIEGQRYDPKSGKITLCLATHSYNYHLDAKLPKAEHKGYLGCGANCRLADPGESHLRGRDLPDGEYCQKTWNKIVRAILRRELLPFPNKTTQAPNRLYETIYNYGMPNLSHIKMTGT